MAYEKFDWGEYAEQLWKDGWEGGHETGIRKGREEQYAEIVEKMKAQGYSDEEIRKLIGECEAAE